MAIAGDVLIKVNSTVLVGKAQSVSDNIKKMQDCFDELERIVNRTSYYWIGEAGDKQRSLYAEQKADVEEMFRRLKEHPADLTAIAQTYEAAEAAVSSVAAELPGDIIS